jgi:hypothetical protein
MPDKTDSRNPSPFAQKTDTELETKDKLQQELPPATSVKKSSTSKKSSVKTSAKKSKLNPKLPYSPSTKNPPKIPLRHPQKIKTAH